MLKYEPFLFKLYSSFQYVNSRAEIPARAEISPCNQPLRGDIYHEKTEGFCSRPIAHTCGPVLELPCSYANYVELRGEFTNILNRGSWEMDIM